MKTIFKNILQIIALAFSGFVLLNIAFIFDAVYQTLIRAAIASFIAKEPDSNLFWFPFLMHISYLFIILAVSWYVFKTKLKAFFKASFLTAPVAAISITIGMFFNRWPMALYLINALFYSGLLYYFSRRKFPWIYYCAVILVAAALAILMATGGDI